MRFCPKHVDAVQALAGHRRPGVRQGDHLGPPTMCQLYSQYTFWCMYLLARTAGPSFDAVAAFDDIGLERDGSWPAVQLQEETAGIAEHRA